MMNILYVSYGAELYGANASLFNLMLDMRKRYSVNPLLLINENGLMVDRCKKENIVSIISPFYRWLTIGNDFSAGAKNVGKNLLNFSKYKKVVRELKNLQIDIIHTNSTITDLGAYLADKMDKPHIWHFREYGIDDYNMYFSVPNFFVKKRFQKSALNIAISKSIYSYYTIERKLCGTNNIKVIYNGVMNHEEYQKNEFIENNRINFCMVGIVSEQKNQKMAIEACKILREYMDVFVLNIIGEGNDDYIISLQNLIKEYGLQKCIKFWGYRQDVSKILKFMDIGLMLSKREAFGRVTIEYMLNYMPVIGVNSGATTEILTQESGCQLCELDDIDRLSRLMLNYIEDKALALHNGMKAYKRAADYFLMERNSDLVYQEYERIYNENKSKTDKV